MDLEYARRVVFFTWVGFDEMDEVCAPDQPNSTTTAPSRSNYPSTSATKRPSKPAARELFNSLLVKAGRCTQVIFFAAIALGPVTWRALADPFIPTTDEVDITGFPDGPLQNWVNVLTLGCEQFAQVHPVSPGPGSQTGSRTLTEAQMKAITAGITTLCSVGAPTRMSPPNRPPEPEVDIQYSSSVHTVGSQYSSSVNTGGSQYSSSVNTGGSQ
jgi:hypothetical protein